MTVEVLHNSGTTHTSFVTLKVSLGESQEALFHDQPKMSHFSVMLCTCTCTGVRVSMLQFTSSESDPKQEKLTDFFQTHSIIPNKKCIESTPLDGQDTLLPSKEKSPMVNSSDDHGDGAAPVTALCPVCNHVIPAENTAMNKHIDECPQSECH